MTTHIAIVNNKEEIVCLAADRVYEVYRDKSNFVLGLAIESSPIPLYDGPVCYHEAGGISLAQVQPFSPDEYASLPKDRFKGYTNFIRRHLIGHVGMAESATHGPDGRYGNPDERVRLYDRAIKDTGGADIRVFGIGSDGHIGLNEPGGSPSSRTHVGVLTEQARHDSACLFGGDIDQVPTRCATQGIDTIMNLHVYVFITTSKGEAQAVKGMIEGGVSQRRPVIALQYHNDVLVIIDEDTTSFLELKDSYKEVWVKENA